jgi:beta-glucosidase
MSKFVFPDGFLWGASTAAHQVEGNNTNSDLWVLEHLPHTIFKEPSGDACDHYHRYGEDIALLARLGFNAYRFSVEWARIEPEDGEFSRAGLEHYRRMLAACHEHGITPVVTYHHFTSPRWLMRAGGWLDEKTPDRFARYCERVTEHLGDLIGVACTLNEPNIARVLSAVLPFDVQAGEWWGEAAQAFGVSPDGLGLFQFNGGERVQEIILASHRRGVEAIKGAGGSFPTGLTLAMLDVQAAEGGESRAAEYQRRLNDCYLEPLRGDDFVGVQTYSRLLIGPEGVVKPGAETEQNQMGEEFYPEALGGTIRHAARVTGAPVIVTENGFSSPDDTRRMEYLRRALRCVVDCLQEGIDVRGYCVWSAFDNFEWVSGYEPKFGVIAVDFPTQARTAKPSGEWLGGVARANCLDTTRA